MERIMKVIVGLFFIVVIAVSTGAILQRFIGSVKIDVTENQVYSLSEGTQEILDKLKQPLTIRLFYSKTAATKAPDRIRVFNNYYEYVKALLEEYARQSGGMVNLEVVDPRPYSQEELAAIRHGLRRFSITEEEGFMFGLVLQTQFGVTKTIEFFAPERQSFVEYDISSLIDSAINWNRKQVVGVLSSLPVTGDDVSGYMAAMMRMQGQQPKPAWGLVRQLKQSYDVQEIPVDTPSIEEVDILLIIHPKDLSDQTLYAIDQYVLGGGRAIVAVDPYSIADRPDPAQMQYGRTPSSSSNLPKLLARWGLKMPENTFAGDRSLAVEGSTAPNRPPEKILPFPKLTDAENCFNEDVEISANLNEMTFMFPGVLEKTEDETLPEDLEYTELLRTSKEGNTWTISSPYELQQGSYGEFMRRFRDGSEPQVMGYQVSGTFTSAFPDGKPQSESEDETEEDGEADSDEILPGDSDSQTHLAAAQELSSVIVIADVDFLSDLVAYRDTLFGLATVGDNAAFVLNSVDAMTGSTSLLKIRSRGTVQRPFTVVEQKEQEAEQRYAKQEEEILAQIKQFEQELNQKLASLQQEGQQELINQTILEEKNKIELQLREAETRLRQIRNEKVKAKEGLKNITRAVCTLPGPLLTLLIAIGLGTYRSLRRRYYLNRMQRQ